MHKSWGNAVDKTANKFVQTLNLITSSTMRPLNNSQITTLKHFLSAANAQVSKVFTQVKLGGRPLLMLGFYPLSPAPISSTKLNKGFIL